MKLVQGNIALSNTDCIVNAANSQLAHGSGVARAICSAGGPSIQFESSNYVEEKGDIPIGSACTTGGGNLKAKHVIHAVGPAY